MRIKSPESDNSAGRLLAMLDSIGRSHQLWQTLPKLTSELDEMDEWF